jgi:ABC-type phosphate transport system substrate-binding protein
MRAAATVLIALLTLAALGASGRAQAPPKPVYVVIVNPSNPVDRVERKFLEDAFLKKITQWSNDQVIRPADLSPSSSVRQRFTEDVLRRTLSAVKSYWQQRIFAGRDVPPPELDRDDDVVAYVLKHEGAIGYVSGDARLSGAKIVPFR